MAMPLRFSQDMAWGLVNATMDAAKIVSLNPELAPPAPQSLQAIHMVLHSLSILSHLARRPTMEISLDLVLEVMLLVLTSIMSQSPWDQLQPIMELLGDSNLQEGDFAQFHGRLHDIRTNLKHFREATKAHNEAPASSSSKEKELSRSVQHHYTGLLADLRDAIPTFQVEHKAVASLPLFSAVANIQLLMLAEGIRSGESWGFSGQDVRDLFRGELEERMGWGGEPVEMGRGGMTRRNVTGLASDEASFSEGAPGNRTAHVSKVSREKRQMQLLSEALAKGKASGWSPELLETWKRAYMGRTVRIPAGREQDEYPRYVRSKYDQGRVEVRPARRDYIAAAGFSRRGWKTTQTLQPLGEYDAVMGMAALVYSEYWPYLVVEEGKDEDKDEVPQRVLLKMDREVYAGPYGPWAEATEVPWSVRLPPPTRPRPGRMASMVVWSKQIVNAVQVRYGERWEVVQGSNKTGSAYLMELAEDEGIHSIEVAGKLSGAGSPWLTGAWGRTIEALRFTSNKAAYGPYGRGTCTPWAGAVARNASGWGVTVRRPGYRLSAVQLSRTLPVSKPRLKGPLGWLVQWLASGSRVLDLILRFPKRTHCHESHGHEAVYFGFRSILLEPVPETATNGTAMNGRPTNGTAMNGRPTNRTTTNRTATNRTEAVDEAF